MNPDIEEDLKEHEFEVLKGVSGIINAYLLLLLNDQKTLSGFRTTMVELFVDGSDHIDDYICDDVRIIVDIDETGNIKSVKLAVEIIIPNMMLDYLNTENGHYTGNINTDFKFEVDINSKTGEVYVSSELLTDEVVKIHKFCNGERL